MKMKMEMDLAIAKEIIKLGKMVRRINRNKSKENQNKNPFLNLDHLIKSKELLNHFNPRMFLTPTNQANNSKITQINKTRIAL